MSFSAEFLAILIYGALIWCAVTALGLGSLLIRDAAKGHIW